MSLKTKNRGIVIFLILLISLIVFFSYQNVKDYNNLKEVFLEEKNILETDLDKIIADYDKIIDKNVRLESDLREKRLMVVNLRDSVSNLEESNFQLMSSFRAKILSLEEENRALFLKVDYLNNANTALLQENNKVKKQLQHNENLNNKLKNQNEKLVSYGKQLEDKIDVASEIQVSKMLVSAMRQKADKKYTETTKYRKTDAFKVTFTLRENKVAESGDRNVFVSVFDNYGNAIRSQGEITLTDGRLVSYSSVINFSFKNSEISLFSFIEVNKKELKKGDYYFKIYSEGKLVNTNKITLK